MPSPEAPSLDFPGADADATWTRVLAALTSVERAVLSGPVTRTLDHAELRARVAAFDLDAGAGDDAMDTVLALLEQAATHTVHPRYFGLFNPTPAAWGQVADLVAARLNPQLAVWTHAAAAVEMERRALSFVAERMGLSNGGAFFTSGGEEANRSAVQVALTRMFPDVAEAGLRALPGQPVFYVSSESHRAWFKIAAGLGLGREALRLVPTDIDFAMDADILREMIARDRGHGRVPFMIGATAGTTAAGAVDPLARLADVAVDHRLALHVDAAWAGAALLSDRWHDALAGIERADSVTIDAHKWLSQPMGTGMFFTRSAGWLAAAFDVSASYMPDAVGDATDYYRLSPQWSRPFRGLRLFLTLAAVGRRAYAAQIDRDVALGDHLRRRLHADGWLLVNRTPFPVVCFTRPGREDDTAWHEQAATRVVGSGAAWISTVRLAGRPALRACITSYRSTTDDVDALLESLRTAAAS